MTGCWAIGTGDVFGMVEGKEVRRSVRRLWSKKIIETG